LYKCSLLYSAARSGHIAVVRTLVTNCAHINSKSSKNQSTPLHVACYYGYEDIVQFLLEHGADPEIKNRQGFLPHQEVPVNKPGITELLTNWKRPTLKQSGGKMVVSYLVYGDRLSYLKGLETLLGKPTLTMKEEFARALIFYEKDSGYHKTPDIYSTALTVLSHLQTFPQARILSSEEILALRIYTGPFYVVINQFLRDINQASKKQRSILLSKQNTWVSTILHLNAGVRKLASLSQMFPLTYRGVDKPLKPEFFVPDRRCLISATEFGFMSTSTVKESALEFCRDSTSATLFCVHPRMEDASGYHMGASLSWCSEHPTEDEILFPPLTLFEVLKRKKKGKMTKITVVPTFV